MTINLNDNGAASVISMAFCKACNFMTSEISVGGDVAYVCTQCGFGGDPVFVDTVPWLSPKGMEHQYENLDVGVINSPEQLIAELFDIKKREKQLAVREKDVKASLCEYMKKHSHIKHPLGMLKYNPEKKYEVIDKDTC